VTLMLKNEEWKLLIIRAKAGDKAAEDSILQNNLNLVRSIVHRFMNRGYEWDDLFQIGCMGLLKAIKNFDLRFDVRFSTYAVPMIIGEIRRYIRDDNPIKVSRSVRELAYRVHHTQEYLQGVFGREPTIAEIAFQLAIAPQEIVSALEAVQPPASLYDQFFHDNGDAVFLLDQIRYQDNQDGIPFDNLALQEVLSHLPPRESAIIKMRFFEDKTQTEIALLVGLSQVQVSRLEKRALKSIREFLQTT